MNTLQFLFGEGTDLTMLQMSIRTFITFLILLILIRFAGMRTFAKKSSFDSIIVIMLGAVLVRGVVGASPYWSTVAAVVVMVIMHNLEKTGMSENDLHASLRLETKKQRLPGSIPHLLKQMAGLVLY